MRLPSFLLFLILISALTNAQSVDSIASKLRSTEDSLIYSFPRMRNAASDIEKLSINDSILRLYRSLLNTPGSFSFPLDSVKWAGSIYAPDKSFRIINWNVELTDGTHRHFGFIQPNNIASSKQFYELIDRTEAIPNPEGVVLSAGKWLGCLYYKILKNKVDNKVYYTLLAIQYHNLFTTRKIIDVLYFDEYGSPVFGAPIFQVSPKKAKLRMVFEFSSQVIMNLKYDEPNKRILFDHLEPSEPKYTGIYEFYGPDLSTDGLKFDKKHWVYLSNIEVRKPDSPKFRPRNNNRPVSPVR